MNTCFICKEVSDARDLSQLPCGHSCHKICMLNWLGAPIEMTVTRDSKTGSVTQSIKNTVVHGAFSMNIK